MANRTAFDRVLTPERIAQGFKSQAQLDAFYARWDHDNPDNRCPACKALDSWIPFEDGYQPTCGACPIARELYSAYIKVN